MEEGHKMSAYRTVAAILGNPVYWGSPYRDHTPEQLAQLRALGVNTLVVNLAWSRPWMDAVTLEEVVASPSYPWLSDPAVTATNAARLRAHTSAVVAAGLRPFFLFGCPKQIDLSCVPPEFIDDAEELIGAPVSRIAPGLSVACIQSEAVRRLYRELLAAFFAAFPETAGILFYTVDELAEVCDDLDDCPVCAGVPLEDRLPDFLAFLRQTIDDLKPGVAVWWEPWEFSAAQVYAVVERLAPRIGLAVHSSIHEVYYVNRPDLWLRRTCALAASRGTEVVVESFFSGTGEDLGPLPAYPCPRLVWEQLAAIGELPGVVGIKEYFGIVAEHISANEAALADWLGAASRGDGRPAPGDWPDALGRVLAPYGAEAAGHLATAWEEAACAVEAFPWDLSWRMRQYNSVRYDQGFGGDGYWAQGFPAGLPTPWTTPSWESSRQAYYVVSVHSGALSARLLEETYRRLGQAAAHLDVALLHLEAALPNVAPDMQAGVCRQSDSVRLFRYLTISRLLHLEASRLAAACRAAGPEDADDLDCSALVACLRADLANALALHALVVAGEYQGFDVPALAATIEYMQREIDACVELPTAWCVRHLL
jgi:hypothetical protein